MNTARLDNQLQYEDKAWTAIVDRLRDVRDWEGSLIEMGLDAACDAPEGERGWHWNMDCPTERSCKHCINRGRYKVVASLLQAMRDNGLLFQYGGDKDKIAGVPEVSDGSDEEVEAWSNLSHVIKKRVLKQRLKRSITSVIGNMTGDEYYKTFLEPKWKKQAEEHE